MVLVRSESCTDEDVATTAIAINRDKNSQHAVKWAADNLLNPNKPHCILVHVRTQSTHPHEFDDASKDGRQPTQAESQHLFLPYRGFCKRKGIEVTEVVLYDIDVPSALVDYVTNNSIRNMVIGASSKNTFLRKFRTPDVPSTLLKSAPETCGIYVIAKGKVQTERSPTRPLKTIDRLIFSKQRTLKTLLSRQSSKRIKRSCSFDAKDMVERNKLKSSNSVISPSTTLSVESLASVSFSRNTSSDSNELSDPLTSISTNGQRLNENLEHSSTSQSSTSSTFSPSQCEVDGTQVNINLEQKDLEREMKKLRHDLKRSMKLYNSVCKEVDSAKEKTRELQQWKAEKERKLEEAKLSEEAAFALADIERQKTKAATEAATMAQRLAEMEFKKRRYAEMKAKQEAEERFRAIERMSQNHIQYRRYTIDEIEAATNYFAQSQRIGEGGYGPVYKAMLNHTAVAIKVLRPDLSQGQRQFHQEVEVLSCMRHPNMVILVGACPEYGCLVYEYMDNGSLEDRLFRKNNSPPIPWKTRFRIAAEIATALLFLHQAKPEPLVHRDLKPANILLDRNYVSKIADVGLARLVPASIADSVTQYRLTAAAGTFNYIDPEYQKTGRLTVKSDLYSLGVMLLQIITAEKPAGLSYKITQAIKDGSFLDILDPAVPDWPIEEALSLAKLALKCCELSKKDRPDLATAVLPELNRLRDYGMEDDARIFDKSLYVSRPYNSVPEAPVNQITVRRGWRYLKCVARIQNLRKLSSTLIATSTMPEKTRRSEVTMQKNMEHHLEGCLQFASCSTPNSDSKMIKAFSS